MIKVGDKLPAAKLQEFIEVEGNGCSIGPNTSETAALTAGKTIAVFGSLSDGTSTVAPKKSGVIRIGVVDPNNKSGRTISTSAALAAKGWKLRG